MSENFDGKWHFCRTLAVNDELAKPKPITQRSGANASLMQTASRRVSLAPVLINAPVGSREGISLIIPARAPAWFSQQSLRRSVASRKNPREWSQKAPTFASWLNSRIGEDG